MEEFIAMMAKTNLERESSFGNLHFKLRLLNLNFNPLKDFDFKINKILKSYYESRFQKLFICTSNYQKLP
jgi:hypothetical protein